MQSSAVEYPRYSWMTRVVASGSQVVAGLWTTNTFWALARALRCWRVGVRLTGEHRPL